MEALAFASTQIDIAISHHNAGDFTTFIKAEGRQCTVPGSQLYHMRVTSLADGLIHDQKGMVGRQDVRARDVGAVFGFVGRLNGVVSETTALVEMNSLAPTGSSEEHPVGRPDSALDSVADERTTMASISAWPP